MFSQAACSTRFPLQRNLLLRAPVCSVFEEAPRHPESLVFRATVRRASFRKASQDGPHWTFGLQLIENSLFFHSSAAVSIMYKAAKTQAERARMYRGQKTPNNRRALCCGAGVGRAEAERAEKLRETREDAGEEENGGPHPRRRRQPAAASGNSSLPQSSLADPRASLTALQPRFPPQDVVEASVKRVVHLAAQWEKHRAPLVEEHRRLKALCSNQDVGGAVAPTQPLCSRWSHCWLTAHPPSV